LIIERGSAPPSQAQLTIQVNPDQPAATPTFTPSSGAYNAAQNVTIKDATANATIYYTTNGTNPTTSSTKYNGPFAVSLAKTIEAIAVEVGYLQSGVGTASYTIAPAVTTGYAGSITTSAAVLNGTVNPNGRDTMIWFLFAANSLMSGAVQSNSYDAGSGTSSVPVQYSVTGKSANTKYYYQVVGQNSAGTVKGSVQSFTTAALKVPTVTTGSAGSITSSTAVLNGRENPNGTDTTIWFLIAANSSMSGAVQSNSYDAGSGTSTVAVQYSVAGKGASTKYYYQVVGQNSVGTVKGTAQSFTTSAPPKATTVSIGGRSE
jgi:phosphodiesterase/alkaline phosphatase D-like protein